MNFDEQFRPTFDALAERLRADMTTQLNTAMVELAATAEKLAADMDASYTDAVARAVRQAWSDAQQETSDKLRASLADVETRARTNFQNADFEAGERFAAAIRVLDRAESLTAILDGLVAGAAAEAARAAVFVAADGSLRSWRFAGFDPSPDERGALDLPLATGDLLTAAATTRSVKVIDGSTHDVAPAFAALAPGRQAVAAPLVMGRELIGVLYADQGDGFAAERESWKAMVEVLARYASRAIEALTAQRMAHALTAGQDPQFVTSR